jgi:hypothetical protein
MVGCAMLLFEVVMKKKKLKYKVGDILAADTAHTFIPLMVTEILTGSLDETVSVTYYRVARLDGVELTFPCWPVDLVDATWRLIA